MTEDQEARTQTEQTNSSWIKLAIAGAVVLVAVVGGFFAWHAYSDSQKEADIPGIEQEIADGVKAQNDGAEVTVDCPSSIDWEVGGEFHCVVEAADGSRAQATVSMENDEGDITWRVG